MYVAIEGIDGVGKSTQIELLKNSYDDAIVTKEPGATPLGATIREMVLGDNSFCKEAEMLLFLADRAEHIDKVINPNRGRMILSDRSLVSGIAYAEERFDEHMLLLLNRFAVNGTLPDKVVILTITKEALEQRFHTRNEEKDSIEKRGIPYLLKVQQRMIEAAKNLGLEYITIDATGAKEDIEQSIKDFIDD